MSETDVQLILHRLEEMTNRLNEIHDEVKRTNGRVTDLEVENARWDGKDEAKRMQNMIIATVLSGGILAVVIAFVTQAI